MTLYERMQATWATGGALALHSEAERLAHQGVAESDIYAALEQLLLSLRESGLDDESDDRINDAMDRLTGWCHPSRHIRTTRDAPPSEKDARESAVRVPDATNDGRRAVSSPHGRARRHHPEGPPRRRPRAA
ncbi:MAG: hypothetical protein K2V38_01095 [Gemmataceae bacterium]|nr:hypothetical protein [Gemmataceae bacterium]